MELERMWIHSPINRLRSQMDRLLNDVFGGEARSWHPAWTTTSNALPLNVWQDGDAIHVEAELPGVDLNDVELNVHEGELSLRGRRPEAADGEGTLLHRERPSGEFEGTLALPVDVDVAKAEATLENGVLHVRLPKVAAARPRRIEIQAK